MGDDSRKPIPGFLLTPPSPAPTMADGLVKFAWTASEAFRVSPVSFSWPPPDLPTPHPGSFQASPSNAALPRGLPPPIRFLFLMGTVRRRLRSDPASRRAPLALAIWVGATSAHERLSPQTQSMPGTPRTTACLRKRNGNTPPELE